MKHRYIDLLGITYSYDCGNLPHCPLTIQYVFPAEGETGLAPESSADCQTGFEIKPQFDFK